MTKKKVFCTKCGTKNNIKGKTCTKCHKSLTRKFNPLLEYMKSKVKDDLKDNVTDKFFSIITNYIKSNLYGAILSVSILVSATCVVVNEVVDNNGIQKVTEKPAIVNEIVYSGEGLSALDFARKYISALDSNDFNTVKSLQLENFHKDVFNYVKEYSDKNTHNFFDTAATVHELSDNPKIYFSYNQDDIYIGDSELVPRTRTFGNYTTENFYVVLRYCSYNSCEDANFGENYRAGIEIQLINIDNNYYVLGEKVALMMGEDEEIYLQALHRANGDTSEFSFMEAYDEFMSCEFDIDCLHQHGFEDSSKRWQ